MALSVKAPTTGGLDLKHNIMKQHILDAIRLDRIECEGGGIVSQRAYIGNICVGVLYGHNGTQPDGVCEMQGPEDLKEPKVLQDYKQGLLDEGLNEYEAGKLVACLQYDLIERPKVQSKEIKILVGKRGTKRKL